MRHYSDGEALGGLLTEWHTHANRTKKIDRMIALLLAPDRLLREPAAVPGAAN